MESCECGAAHCGTIIYMGPTFVGFFRHFSSRQTICRPLLMARRIIEEPHACGETFSLDSKILIGPISLLEQVFIVKVTFHGSFPPERKPEPLWMQEFKISQWKNMVHTPFLIIS